MANSSSFKQGFYLEWKIENLLSARWRGSSEFIFDEHRWMLVLENVYPYVTLRIYKVDSKNLTRTYTTRCFIKDKIENPVHSMENCLDDRNFSAKCIWRIPVRVIQKQSDNYLVNGSLMLVFILLLDGTRENKETQRVSDKSVQTLDCPNMVVNFENLSLDFKQLLIDGTHSDMTLQCGEKSFHAHKGILSARSPVFSAMFQSDMVEHRSGLLQITDMDPPVLNQFLQYIYCGQISDLTMDIAPKLYTAADKYAIDSLRKICLNFMKENLSRENACEILLLADTHADKDLKDCVLSFIVEKEILRDKSTWLQFHNEHPDLASEVMFYAYEAKCVSK